MLTTGDLLFVVNITPDDGRDQLFIRLAVSEACREHGEGF